MVQIKKSFVLAVCLLGISGCAEFRAMVSILFNGANSLSTSAFEFDDLKSGDGVACMILGDKTVRCLGGGAKGSLGTFNGGPVQFAGDIKQVVTGKQFSCILVGQNSQVYCFGRNDLGQLGNSTVLSSVKPIPVLDKDNNGQPLKDVKSISAGFGHACALLRTNRAICWGDNSFGQIGASDPSFKNPNIILDADKLQKQFENVHAIVAGGNSTCLIGRDDSAVFCFGQRIGDTKKFNPVPGRIEILNGIGTLTGIKSVGVGEGFACALGKSSQVYCWGRNDLNQLGTLSNLQAIDRAVPVRVTYPQEMPLSHVEDITVGAAHACALHRGEKTVFCWGDNRLGQLGNSSVRGNPEQVALGSNNLTLKGVKSVSAGADRTCIITDRDEVFCWGNGADGKLGNEKVLSQYPTRVLDTNFESLSGAQQLTVGFDHSCIIDTSQKLYCFGLNDFGQLGIRMISSTAALLGQKTMTKVTAIDTYAKKTCVVQGPDQSVVCFGGRDVDNLNSRPERNSFVPEEVKRSPHPFRNAMGVTVGKKHVCVIESGQTVSCIYYGDVPSSTVSTQILSYNHAVLKDIWQAKSRGDWTCGLTQELGEIWCWGTFKGAHYPEAVALTTNGKRASEFIQLAASEDQVCGVRGTERTVYCSKMGEVKLDHLDLAPMRGPEGKAMREVMTLAAGAHHFCATLEDGKLVCWGENEHGQLGVATSSGYQAAVIVKFKEEQLKKVSKVTAGDESTCVTNFNTPSLFCFGKSFFGSANTVDPIEYPL